MTELADLSVAELLEAYASGSASPVEALESCLGRIERLDTKVGAFLTVTDELALSQARDSTERWRHGLARPLEGVPYGLKDIIATAGIRTTGGSAIYADHVPTMDAVVAARLQAAGGVLVGKLATFEFASGVNAATSNPWDLDRTAAGSSSGSAAALAAYELPLTVGTDTGGSITIPANFVGVVGLKATYGRVPRAGVMPLSWTLDHVGPMTRTARDAGLALAAMAGRDPRDPTSSDHPVPDYDASIDAPIRDLRIGVPTDWYFDIIDPAVESATRAALGVLIDAGMVPVEIPFPRSREVDLHAIELTLIYAELASNHEVHGPTDTAGFGPQFSRLHARAQFVSAVDYLKALRARHFVQLDFEAGFDVADVLLVPGAITVAPRHDHMVARLGDQAAETTPWAEVVSRTTAIHDIAGVPSIALPAGLTSDGLPVGIQLVARPFAEPILLRTAHAFQQLTSHHLAAAPLVKEDRAHDHPRWGPATTRIDRLRPVVTATLDDSW
jgi:aspartyl-tRNA(Asn)/glutamyl-tRNA(Gln) amidotransferase subunit A